MEIVGRNVLEHRKLGAPRPWDDSLPHDKYELDFEVRNGRLIFRFTQKPAPPSGQEPAEAESRPGKKTQELDLKIDRDCWVEISLKNPNVRWSVMDAITIGKEYRDNYFNLQYFENGSWQSQYDSPAGSWSQMDPAASCQRIRFGAKKAPSETDDKHSAINFNLFFENEKGEYLPITVDPDIKNPGTKP